MTLPSLTLFLLQACGDKTIDDTSTPEDTSTTDTTDTADTIDTTDTTDTMDTTDTSDTIDTTDTTDTHDTTDTGEIQTDGPILYFEDKMQVGGTNIWSHVIGLENDFIFSTIQQGQVAYRRYNLDFNPSANYITVTSPNDMPSGAVVADQNVIAHNQNLFFTVSGFDNKDLFLVKMSMDGQRQGYYLLQDNQATPPTNDMHLVVVGEQICVRWGASGFEKTVQCFSENLDPLFAPLTISTPEPTPQLGATIVWNGEIRTFTGDPTQRSLQYTRYDLDWNPLSPFAVTILPTENDDWNWFPSGVVYHEIYDMWFIAYTHMEQTQEANHDSIVRLAAFDGNFQLLDMKTLSTRGYTRPHLTIVGDELIVGYDNQNLVYLEKWRIQAD